jgi:outer membrane protein assembly factor BamB
MTWWQVVAGCAWIASAQAQVNARGNLSGSGEFAVKPLREVRGVAWEAKPGFRDFGPMVQSGDVLVSGNITGRGGVFAFSAATGKPVWSLPGGQLHGDPAVDSQAVYAVTQVDSTHYRLRSLELKTGKVRWSVEDEYLGASVGGPVSDGSRVYLVSQNGKVRAYDALTGKVIWEQAYSTSRGSCPTALSLADGILYFGGGDSANKDGQGRYLWALEAAGGKVLWRYQAMPDAYTHGGACVTSPAVADGTVTTSAANLIYALDAKSGTLRWQRPVTRMEEGRQRAQDLGPALITGGIVYCASKGGLSGWDLKSGSPVFDLPGAFRVDGSLYRLAAAGGVLYFIADMEPGPPEGAFRWPLYALDLATKKILWKQRTNRPSPYESIASWRTAFLLPVDGAVYYEKESVLAKLQ